MDTASIAGHVNDGNSFHFPFHCHVDLPMVEIFGQNVQITKFMVIEALVAILMILFFVPLASKIKKGEPVRGRFSNLLEVFLLFIRDQVARPCIGHGADRFVPLLWTIFFFVLGMNLFGMIPGFGSPTASYSVTAVLAVVALLTVVLAGSYKIGPVKFWLSQVPHMDVPFGLAYILKPLLFVIEVFGLFVKHFVLCIRLFANLFAGHLVLAVFTSFITAAATGWLLWTAVTVPSVALAVAISLLEIFVAFLQAYIFTFLMSLFIGMARHPH